MARLPFESDVVVYPMRLSQSATRPQTVDLYVLSDHRMDPSSVPVLGDPPSLAFAGRLDQGMTSPVLAPFLAKGTFLTRWNDDIERPDAIDGDFVLTAAPADTPYQRVVVVTRNRGDLAGLILLAVVGLAAVVATLTLFRRRTRRSRPAS